MKKFTEEQALSFYEGLAELSNNWDIEKTKQEKEKILKECKAEDYEEIAKSYEMIEKLYSLSHSVKEWLDFKTNNPKKEHNFDKKILSIFEELKATTEELRKMQKARENRSTITEKPQETLSNEKLNNNIETLINIAVENPLTQKMFSGKSTNALARARTIGKFEPLEGKLVVEGVNIFSPESVQKIGVGTAKIYRYAVAEFTKHNEKNATGEKIKQRLLLDVKDFAAANGVDINSTDAMKNFRRKLKKSLETLLTSHVSWTEKIKGKEATFSGLNYIGSYDLKSNTLNIEFTLKMAEYLTSLPLIEYPRSLYALDDRDYNAFAIGETMCIHYSIDNNVIRKTEGKLKVETLLKATSFPTYEKLKEQKSGWEANVQEPFENALDKLKQCGFLKDWKYCYAGDIEIADEEVRAGTIDSYEKFISLIVKYELNDFAPHEERATEITKKKAEKIKRLQSKRKNKKKTDDN